LKFKHKLILSTADAGSKILESSPSIKKPSKILTEDKDSYLLVPTNNLSENFIIIELSEEILMV
jgi:hypothetical protein